MTSNVSIVSDFVANGHQIIPYGSCSLSKIPYVGFFPVRLQTGSRLRPSLVPHRLKCMTHIHPSNTNLYAAGTHGISCSLVIKACLRSLFPRAFPSRGPWLAHGLCCPTGSLLTMASSETLGFSLRLICFVLGGLCPTVC
jgi:hypothetical protein